MGKRGKLEVYALFNRKPMKMFKNTRRVCVLSESVTGNDSGKCVLNALEPIDIFLCSRPTVEKSVGIVQAGADKRRCNKLSHIVSYSRTNMAE